MILAISISSKRYSGLVELPTDIIISILEELDLPTLLACAQVCQLFYAVIRDDVGLQYKIELEAAGMIDGSQKCLSIADRLTLLKEHQQAWKSMKWTEAETLNLLADNLDLNIMTKNIICQRMEGHRDISFTQLPSKYTSEKRWTLDFNFKVRLCAFDVSQDLLILAEPPEAPNPEPWTCCFHICSLSSGRPHPLANEPIISHGPKMFLMERQCKIYEDHLAVGFDINSEEGIVVWNWKTGLVELHLEEERMQTFAFLTDDLIMVAHLHDNGPHTINYSPQLLVYSISLCNKTGRPLCALEYPPLLEIDLSFMSFTVFPTTSPREADHIISNIPFLTDHLNKLIAVLVSIAGEDVDATCILFLPLSSIHSAIESVAARPDGDYTILWPQWGPQGPRMIIVPEAFLWGINVDTHGLKAAFVLEDDNGVEKAHLFDFNQWVIRRSEVDNAKDEECSWWVPISNSEESKVLLSRIFSGEVTTSLPGRTATIPLSLSNEDDGWVSILLNDNTIVAVAAGRCNVLFIA